MIRTYSELCQLETFLERFEYLKLKGAVGEATFGYDRYLNQRLYRSSRWRSTRNSIIVRDEGCDLACPGYEIHGRLLVHHINPITVEDLIEERDIVYDPRNLVCVSHRTHQAIHYGDQSLLPKPLVVRHPGDTTLW